ncbi:MAG: hypothetical protein U0892_21305 [Pirellulales bacterium]
MDEVIGLALCGWDDDVGDVSWIRWAARGLVLRPFDGAKGDVVRKATLGKCMFPLSVRTKSYGSGQRVRFTEASRVLGQVIWLDDGAGVLVRAMSIGCERLAGGLCPAAQREQIRSNVFSC